LAFRIYLQDALAQGNFPALLRCCERPGEAHARPQRLCLRCRV